VPPSTTLLEGYTMRLPAALGLAVVALLILAVAVLASWQNYQVIAETFQSMHSTGRGDGPSIAIVMGEFIAGLFMVEAFGGATCCRSCAPCPTQSGSAWAPLRCWAS
jgi:hypothetical protein